MLHPVAGPTLLAALLAALLAGCAGEAAPAQPDARLDRGPDAAPTWATYQIDVGRHDATILGGTDGNPVRTLTQVDGRDYLFAFDASAMYVLTDPVEPNDQLDWNKLPGLSDCDTIDLSAEGAMFGWRWRLDLDPPVLEVTAYANNAGVHLTAPAPLATLTAADLAAAAPLRYRLWSDGARYRFTVAGAQGARTIDAAVTLPRACPAQPPAQFRWASGLYFGGTSTAPSIITGQILERPFAGG
ncbi:MAG: hypothetical protein IPL61_16645 [Myxococcales bacterium]|nr:hypothetical protein [Myxococcales bacterium]